jgi:hypothetical protein
MSRSAPTYSSASELFVRGMVCVVALLLVPLITVVALTCGLVWWGKLLVAGGERGGYERQT